MIKLVISIFLFVGCAGIFEKNHIRLEKFNGVDYPDIEIGHGNKELVFITGKGIEYRRIDVWYVKEDSSFVESCQGMSRVIDDKRVLTCRVPKFDDKLIVNIGGIMGFGVSRYLLVKFQVEN